MDLDGVTIFPFPAWSDNPYINLLYLAPRAEGAAIEQAKELEVIVDQLGRATARDIVHVHWTAPICQVAETETEAEERLALFQAAVVGAKSRGVRIVWTVHNTIPHDVKYLDIEIRLNQFLSDSADLVHIMNPATPQTVAEYYQLPLDRTVTIPHSSYLGIYGSRPRSEAREHFGITNDEKVVLFLGQMRPYKGLGTLLRAVELAHDESAPLVLLLAGKTDAGVLATIDSMLPPSVRVIREHNYIDDHDVDLWFAAADVAVFPYNRILNSGSVHLASTFGVPCILPNEPHLIEQFANEPWVSFFDQSDEVNSLAEALRAWEDPSGQLSDSAREASERYTPYAMSSAYLKAISALG